MAKNECAMKAEGGDSTRKETGRREAQARGAVSEEEEEEQSVCENAALKPSTLILL